MSRAWAEVLKSTWIRDADPQNLRFTEVPSEEPDGGLSVVLDRSTDVVMSGSAAAQALNDVCVGLAASRPDSVTSYDLTVDVMRAAAKAARRHNATFQELVQQVESWTSKSVVAVPIGGVFSSAMAAIPLGDSVIAGHLSRETEQLIGELAVRHGLHGFRFTTTWWTEQFLAAEADAAIAAEIAGAEEEEGSWQPFVVALALPAVGVVASCRAVWATEAFLGALIVMHEPQPTWFSPKPWIMGQASVADNPRCPTLGNDGALSEVPIQVDSLPDHSLHGYAPLEHGKPVSDLDLAEEVEDPQTEAVLTRLARATDESSVQDRQLVAACRLAFAASQHPSDIGLVLLDRATSELQNADVPKVDTAWLSSEDAFEQAHARWSAFRDLLVEVCASNELGDAGS